MQRLAQLPQMLTQTLARILIQVDIKIQTDIIQQLREIWLHDEQSFELIRLTLLLHRLEIRLEHRQAQQQIQVNLKRKLIQFQL